MHHREDLAEFLGHLLAGRAGVKPGRMFGSPAFYVEGRLFAVVFGDGVALKLPAERVAELAQEGIPLFEPYGKRMRAWIHIRKEDADAYADDAHLVLESLAWVRASG